MFQIIRNLLWRQPSAPHQETYEGYLPYFEHDNFPLKWHKTISESPSAQSCVSTIADFMEGFGFSVPKTGPNAGAKIEDLIVNSEGETFFKIHHKTCQSFAEFEGFAWHFMFNGSGQIAEIRVLPFENCRLAKPDDNGVISKIYYNPYFGTDHYGVNNNKKATKIYDTFNYEAAKSQLIRDKSKYKGQVLYVGTTTATSRFYPYPEAKSAEKWMRTEAGISDYHEDNINNGLLQPYVLVMKGDPNQPSTNPEYSNPEKPITIGEEFQMVMDQNFMGAKRVGNVWVQWVNTGEEAPEVVPLPTNANGDLFVTLDNQATKKITVAFKVPAILANIQEGVSLGGDGNTVRVAVKLMQQRCIKKQRILTDAYSMIMKNFVRPWLSPIIINPYNPYPELAVLDDKIWNAMTTDEQRKWIMDNTEIELTEGPQPEAPTQARALNSVLVEFPDKIKTTVKKAMEQIEVLNLDCSSKWGSEVADKIMNNNNMGKKEMERIQRYLKKRPEYANSPLDSCESIQYHQLGGKAMEDFLEKELNKIEKWLN